MTSQQEAAKGRDIVARWLALAEQRLDYLSELFETGRWRRFHSEQDFLENIREANKAVETWRNLLSCEATLDNKPIDLSWLGRPKTALPKVDMRRDPIPLAPTVQAPIGAPDAFPVLAASERGEVKKTIPALVNDDVAATFATDLAVIAERYPSLRHSL